MSTFKSLVQNNTLTGKERCNLRNLPDPDGCWALQNGNLGLNHILCVEYNSALEDLPKLIIDSFINKYGRKPDTKEFAMIIVSIIESMKSAL